MSENRENFDIDFLSGYIPPLQLNNIKFNIPFFRKNLERLERHIKDTPAIPSEDLCVDPRIMFHYFGYDIDYWVTNLNQETGEVLAVERKDKNFAIKKIALSNLLKLCGIDLYWDELIFRSTLIRLFEANAKKVFPSISDKIEE